MSRLSAPVSNIMYTQGWPPGKNPGSSVAIMMRENRYLRARSEITSHSGAKAGGQS
jgi:hypothetical protein